MAQDCIRRGTSRASAAAMSVNTKGFVALARPLPPEIHYMATRSSAPSILGVDTTTLSAGVRLSALFAGNEFRQLRHLFRQQLKQVVDG
jgi:hypothetical protein